MYIIMYIIEQFILIAMIVKDRPDYFPSAAAERQTVYETRLYKLHYNNFYTINFCHIQVHKKSLFDKL